MNNSELQKIRRAAPYRLPDCLKGPLRAVPGAKTSAVGDVDEIAKLFPSVFGTPSIHIHSDGSTAAAAAAAAANGGGAGAGGSKTPLRVGVVLSGGQAPGGHNVIAGLYDFVHTRCAPGSVLIGFLGGPKGIFTGKYAEITSELMERYRNMGGFDIIGSGRDKIETPEQFAGAREHCAKLDLDGLIVIGGDDSNTNACLLAENFASNKCKARVLGCPKTIDADLKNEHIPVSFGFDTATKCYSEMIGNIARDCLSSKKYWHFVRLMGRSASHIALECGLKTHPNVLLIGEEVAANKSSLAAVAQEIIDAVVSRAKEGKNYGVCLVPEGA